MRAAKSKPGGKITTPTTPAQFAGLLAARRICTDRSGDEGMRKASTVLLEQGTQAPSPAPDLIPAENEQQNLTGNSHSDWYNKRGHFTTPPNAGIVVLRVTNRPEAA
jgi:hypothetical protein